MHQLSFGLTKAVFIIHKNIKKRKIKKHGRLEKSFFSYGLETLAQVLLNAFVQTIQKFTRPLLSGA